MEFSDYRYGLQLQIFIKIPQTIRFSTLSSYSNDKQHSWLLDVKDLYNFLNVKFPVILIWAS